MGDHLRSGGSGIPNALAVRPTPGRKMTVAPVGRVTRSRSRDTTSSVYEDEGLLSQRHDYRENSSDVGQSQGETDENEDGDVTMRAAGMSRAFTTVSPATRRRPAESSLEQGSSAKRRVTRKNRDSLSVPLWQWRQGARPSLSGGPLGHPPLMNSAISQSRVFVLDFMASQFLTVVFDDERGWRKGEIEGLRADEQRHWNALNGVRAAQWTSQLFIPPSFAALTNSSDTSSAALAIRKSNTASFAYLLLSLSSSSSFGEAGGWAQAIAALMKLVIPRHEAVKTPALECLVNLKILRFIDELAKGVNMEDVQAWRERSFGRTLSEHLAARESEDEGEHQENEELPPSAERTLKRLSVAANRKLQKTGNDLQMLEKLFSKRDMVRETYNYVKALYRSFVAPPELNIGSSPRPRPGERNEPSEATPGRQASGSSSTPAGKAPASGTNHGGGSAHQVAGRPGRALSSGLESNGSGGGRPPDEGRITAVERAHAQETRSDDEEEEEGEGDNGEQVDESELGEEADSTEIGRADGSTTAVQAVLLNSQESDGNQSGSQGQTQGQSQYEATSQDNRYQNQIVGEMSHNGVMSSMLEDLFKSEPGLFMPDLGDHAGFLGPEPGIQDTLALKAVAPDRSLTPSASRLTRPIRSNDIAIDPRLQSPVPPVSEDDLIRALEAAGGYRSSTTGSGITIGPDNRLIRGLNPAMGAEGGGGARKTGFFVGRGMETGEMIGWDDSQTQEAIGEPLRMHSGDIPTGYDLGLPNYGFDMDLGRNSDLDGADVGGSGEASWSYGEQIAREREQRELASKEAAIQAEKESMKRSPEKQGGKKKGLHTAAQIQKREPWYKGATVEPEEIASASGARAPASIQRHQSVGTAAPEKESYKRPGSSLSALLVADAAPRFSSVGPAATPAPPAPPLRSEPYKRPRIDTQGADPYEQDGGESDSRPGSSQAHKRREIRDKAVAVNKQRLRRDAGAYGVQGSGREDNGDEEYLTSSGGDGKGSGAGPSKAKSHKQLRHPDEYRMYNRVVWSKSEEDLLISEVELYHREYDCMAIIMRRHGGDGYISRRFSGRTSVQLKDKAVNIASRWYREGTQLSELRKRAFARFPPKQLRTHKESLTEQRGGR